jgi:hypothetical protein
MESSPRGRAIEGKSSASPPPFLINFARSLCPVPPSTGKLRSSAPVRTSRRTGQARPPKYLSKSNYNILYYIRLLI